MKTIFREYKVGDIIFRQGDPGYCAYIIESGLVQISVKKDGEEFPIVVLGEGEIFGEMAIIDRLPRSATATVLEPCRLSLVSQDSLVERIQNSDPVVRLLVSMFIRRARNMTANVGRANKPSPSPDITTKLGKTDKEALSQVRFESEVKLAFAQGEFLMNYQPIVELDNSQIVGYEALIRWKSPTMGMVRPDQFINIVEDSAMMIPVGRWIIEQAMGDLVHLSQAQGRPLFVSINISPRQLADPGFVDHLEMSCKAVGLEPERVKLEITEQIFLEGAAAIGITEKCRALGFKVALDDFGTGYSSISYLKELILDAIKIDQTFTRSILSDPRVRCITQATISLANALNLECVAEGIESSDVGKALMVMGVRYGQGYHFGKPEPLSYYLANKAAA